jgi:hypothetical protein
MDYLVKISDGTAESLGGTVTKLQLPNQTGGDVVFTGDKRPVDLGDYILVEAKEVDEPLDDTKKRGETTVEVDRYGNVTVTRTAVAKTEAELAQEEINRLENEITPQHMREAILGTDDGWLAAQQELINSEKAKL